jgi:hypothetical protein
MSKGWEFQFKGEWKPVRSIKIRENLSKKWEESQKQVKKIPTSIIKVNDGTQEIEVPKGTKVKKGNRPGEVVGYRNIKGKYFTRFKDEKTGKIELVPISRELKPVEGKKIKPSEAIPDTNLEKDLDVLRDSEKEKGVTLDAFGTKDRGIRLNKISVPKEERGEGKAVEAMGNLIDVADKNGETISLSPTSEFGSSKTRLIKFYKKFGFVENKGKNKDYAISDTMYREPKKPGIKPSEAIPDKPIAPTDQKGKTSGQQRVEDVVDTAKNTKTKSPTKKSKQLKAVSNLAKQVQHNPGGEKKGSGWLNPYENFYFHAKEIAWPILKMRKLITDVKGLKIKKELERKLDFAIDAVRGAGETAQQYIDDNYNPIFDPLKRETEKIILKSGEATVTTKKRSAKDQGKIARMLSYYVVSKRTDWLYKNKKRYEDAGITPEDAKVVVDYIEGGNHPNSDIIQKMAKDLWEYNKGLLDVKYKAGVIDNDLLMNLKEPNYVPFYRDVTTGNDKPSNSMKLVFTSTSTGIKRIKGSKSGHKIIDPLQLMVTSTHEAIMNTKRVVVAQNIIDVAEAHPDVFGEDLIRQYTNPPRLAGSIEHRIQVDENLRDQIKNFAKKMGVNIKIASKLGKKRLGQFNSYDQEISVLYGATESIAAHELGHAIESKVAWVNKLLGSKELKQDMDNIADSRYEGKEVPNKYVRYVRQRDEKIAEFISLYLTNRPVLRNLAPNALAQFEIRLTKDKNLKSLSDIKPTNVKTMEMFNEANWVTDNSMPKDEDIISLRKEGKLVHYRVPLEMAMAIKNLHPKQLVPWMKWTLAVPTMLLRTGAVGLNIGFAIPNIVRDQINAAFNSKNIPFVDWSIGASHFIKNDEVAKEFLRRGGGMSSPESGIKGGKKGYSEIIYGSRGAQFLDPFYWKNRGVLKGTTDLSLYGLGAPFRLIASAVELSEAGSRLGVFSRELKASKVDLNNLKGENAQIAIEEAVHAARHSTIDFNRFGYSGKMPNEIIPFINAAFEGIDRFARAWAIPIQEGRLPVRQAMYTGLMYGIYAGLTAWNREQEEWYSKIPSSEKGDNWIIMKPQADGTYWKIPKDHVTKFVLNPFQMIYETIKGLAQKDGWGLAVDMYEDISPLTLSSVTPVLLKMYIEPITDYNLYWNTTIENPRQKTWPKGFRYKNSTSETLKSIGKALNISPPMLQHETKTLFGGLGGDVLWVVDWALGVSGIQKPPGFDLSRAVVIKRFNGKVEEWKSDASQRLNKINKRLGEIKRGGKNARIKRLRQSGASQKEIDNAVKASRDEVQKLLAKKRELETATRKLTVLRTGIKARGIKLK